MVRKSCPLRFLSTSFGGKQTSISFGGDVFACEWYACLGEESCRPFQTSIIYMLSMNGPKMAFFDNIPISSGSLDKGYISP